MSQDVKKMGHGSLSEISGETTMRPSLIIGTTEIIWCKVWVAIEAPGKDLKTAISMADSWCRRDACLLWISGKARSNPFPSLAFQDAHQATLPSLQSHMRSNCQVRHKSSNPHFTSLRSPHFLPNHTLPLFTVSPRQRLPAKLSSLVSIFTLVVNKAYVKSYHCLLWLNLHLSPHFTYWPPSPFHNQQLELRHGGILFEKKSPDN